MAPVPAIAPAEEIVYPESDGQPMGKTELHLDEIIDLIKALQDYFREVPNVYVVGDLFLYYEEGNPEAVVAPDVFVVKGVGKQKRRIYKLWEEGQAPCMVIEVTSSSTSEKDAFRNKAVYARLGFEEYYLFDPFGEYLEPRLQGFRLMAGRYRPMRPARDGSLISRVVGLNLSVEEGHLRLRDTRTGEPLLRIEEVQRARREGEERARKAEERAEREAAARRVLEAELARLRREMAGRQDNS